MPTSSLAATPVILCCRAGPDRPCVPSAPTKQDGGGHVRKRGARMLLAVAWSLRHRRGQPLPSFLTFGQNASASCLPKGFAFEQGARPTRRNPSLGQKPSSRTALSAGVAHIREARSGSPTSVAYLEVKKQNSPEDSHRRGAERLGGMPRGKTPDKAHVADTSRNVPCACWRAHSLVEASEGRGGRKEGTAHRKKQSALCALVS